ncbi:Component of the BRCA1-A complex [Bulinus truncatus]|nr:Component of the BRCA1-A complex [Bulinus truncatus]
MDLEEFSVDMHQNNGDEIKIKRNLSCAETNKLNDGGYLEPDSCMRACSSKDVLSYNIDIISTKDVNNAEANNELKSEPCFSRRDSHLRKHVNKTEERYKKEKVTGNGIEESTQHLQVLSEPESHCLILPKVNCPEKIILCLDLNEEMDTTNFRSKAGDKYSGLELGKRALRMFVLHKSQMNPKHEFAFLIFHEESTMIQSFTSRAQDILTALDDHIIVTQKSGPFNLSHFYETVKDNIELPIVSQAPDILPPPYVIRVVLVFGRSHSVPVIDGAEARKELESSPYFFTDVLYIHEPPTEENKCEEIFHVLCELDHNGLSYIFEQSKYTPILNSGAKLLAHPLQRPRQLEAFYKIGHLSHSAKKEEASSS